MSRIGKVVITAFAAIGLAIVAAPAAAAGDTDVSNGLVNVNDNNVPIQICHNTVPVNVLGVQVPVNEITGSLGLGLLGGVGSSTNITDSSCDQGGNQSNDGDKEDY